MAAKPTRIELPRIWVYPSRTVRFACTRFDVSARVIGSNRVSGKTRHAMTASVTNIPPASTIVIWTDVTSARRTANPIPTKRPSELYCAPRKKTCSKPSFPISSAIHACSAPLMNVQPIPHNADATAMAQNSGMPPSSKWASPVQSNRYR